MHKKILISIIVLTAGFTLSGCTQTNTVPDNDKVNSVALINTPANLNTNNAVNTVNTANTNRGDILGVENVNVNNVNLAVNINASAPVVNKASDPVEVKSNVIIQAIADKSVYHSNERIALSITLKSDQILSGVTVVARGVESRYGTIYVNETQTVDVRADSSEAITFVSILPECSSCSGIEPGDYTIDVTATHEAKTLATDQLTINLQQ